jgi:hypothetical protein
MKKETLEEEPKTGYVKSETEFLGVEFTLKDGSKQFVPKQETLEEAADNWVRKPVIGTKRESFIAGAKWQAERMYSEEEVKNIVEEARWQVPATGNPREFTKNFDKWFEQFKKK